MSRLTALCIAALLTLGTFSPLFAFDVETSGGADLGSAYVWRGITFNDGTVFQPWLDVTKGPFNVNVWVNYDIDDYDGALDGGEYSEIDLSASWTFDLEIVDVSVGLIEYTFPGGGPGTTEIYSGVSYDTPIENLGLSLTVYYDIDELKDYYASLGVSYSYEIKEGITIDGSLSLGFAGDEYSASGDGGMYDLGVSVAVSYAYKEDISFSASVNYTTTMDEDILPEQDVETYFLIGASYTF